MNALRQLLTASLFAVLAGLSATAAPTNFWFAPNGTGDGTSRDRPRSYAADFVQWQILHGADGRSHDVTMNFLPGEYLVEPFNTSTPDPSDWRIRILGWGRNPEDVVLKLKPRFPKGASEQGGNWVDVIDLGRQNEYIQRFEMENLTVDGNWSGQTDFNHRGYLRGYKNSPVYVNARTGRIRRVLIRDFGAHGLMPQRTNDLGAGVEVFPVHIVTNDEGQQPEDGDPAPWVIEDCEVTGFHSQYNGYTTCLMGIARLNVPNTPRWAWDDTSRRLIWFRRNQVRGAAGDKGVIAQGAAGHGTNHTGKITWSDNVLLNSTMLNTDTGSLRHLDLTNCLGLDAFGVGYVGTSSTRTPLMTDYAITGNSVRFGWALTFGDYSNYSYTKERGQPAVIRAEPSFRLGRRRNYPLAGLNLQGVAEDIRYSGNWFTSRSREELGSLNPLVAREPAYRLVYRMPERDPELSNAPAFFRGDALNVDLRDNRISSVPFDFERMKPLEGGRIAKLTEDSTPLLGLRQALPPSSGFVPMGLVHRVELVLTNVQRRLPWKGVPVGVTNSTPRTGAFEGPDRVLVGAIEVVCGRPESRGSDGMFRLPVRVALQPTPLSGATGTVPLPGRPVFLEVLSGSLHPRRLSAQTGKDGIATFSWPVSPAENGQDRFRVWTDGGNGRTGEWDEYQDAWSTAHQDFGCTISVVVDTDVADAENGNSGRILLRRSGTSDRALKVGLELAPGPNAAAVGSDFRLTAQVKSSYPGGREGGSADVGSTVEFAKGQKEVELQVNPIRDKARAGRLVSLRVLPGEGYGPGEPPEGEVVIYSLRK